MKKITGGTPVNDDEWHTPRQTADKLAAWLRDRLSPDQPILCPADILPDGMESEIPKALRAAGFTCVRVTRDLPIVSQHEPDWRDNEVIVTNPPFSLLVPFREWAKKSGAKFCILSRPGAMRSCWSIPEFKDRFYAADGRVVSAAWMQNIEDTTNSLDPSKAIGNCKYCERKACPKNDMTGHLSPGQDRPLYGYGHAVNMGLCGWYCQKYTINGKISFSRFMAQPE